MKDFVPIEINKPSKYVPYESTISNKILAFLNNVPGCKAHKRHQSGYNRKGDPDIFGCILSRHFEIEVKRPKKKPTSIQIQRLKEWGAVGSIVGLVSSVEETIKVFAEFGITLSE